MRVEYCDKCHKENKGHNFADGFQMDYDKPDAKGQPLKVCIQAHTCGQDGCSVGVTIYGRSHANICRDCLTEILVNASIMRPQ